MEPSDKRPWRQENRPSTQMVRQKVMSGRIHKSRIPIKATQSLPQEIREEIIRAKQTLFTNVRQVVFRNQSGGIGDGPPLPGLPDGSTYIECQLGAARPGDPRPKGSYRVVFEVHTASKRILETYYTDEHYAKFSFFRLV